MKRIFAIPALTLLLCAGVVQAQANQNPAAAAPQIGQVSKDSVWVPTPERLIRRMLQMADTTRDDLVIDLGSGDGRMPIYAARHFGARAIGVELEANLIRVSIESARAQGVSQLTEFIAQDLFEADISKAGVIALYLSPGAMARLKPRLLAQRPGLRVVSHQFLLDDWEPDESIRVEGRNGHLWVVPADVRGTWKVSLAGDEFSVRIDQKYQALTTLGDRAGRPVNVIGSRLRGAEIGFTAFDRDGHSRRFEGKVEGSRMAGESRLDGAAPVRWTAVRQ